MTVLLLPISCVTVRHFSPFRYAERTENATLEWRWEMARLVLRMELITPIADKHAGVKVVEAKETKYYYIFRQVRGGGEGEGGDIFDVDVSNSTPASAEASVVSNRATNVEGDTSGALHESHRSRSLIPRRLTGGSKPPRLTARAQSNAGVEHVNHTHL